MNTYELKPEVKMSSSKKGYSGYDEIAKVFLKQLKEIKKKQKIIAFECYPGVNIDELKSELFPLLSPSMIVLSDDFSLPKEEVQRKIADTITEDRVFGVMSHYVISDFFKETDIQRAKKEIDKIDGLIIVYGIGTNTICAPDILVYADLPRWEIQRRFRYENLSNWKTENPNEDTLKKFKRGYFFEWRLADRIKNDLFEKTDFLLDTNKKKAPKMVTGEEYRIGLNEVAHQPFRLVPYFDASVWGGNWMKKNFGLDPSAINYGWAFDGVPEENSILLNFSGTSIEIPAINLVFRHPNQLLGEKVHARFGTEFPIRFDYLDTMDGGNLSLQVHPLVEYAQNKFGIHYTQEESYYILQATEKSTIYLGVKNETNKEKLVEDLKKAKDGNYIFPSEKYINVFPVEKHDHYSIPPGTIHCGGPDTVVLEISSTPYIFTFKLWDWERTGLDGIPRPVHIEAGSVNILVEKDENYVLENLVSKKSDAFENLSNQEGVMVERTGLSDLQFIETRRHWFKEQAFLETFDSVNMLNLVEGEQVSVESVDDSFAPLLINYGETFIVPECIKKYKIRNIGNSTKPVAILQAFVRNL